MAVTTADRPVARLGARTRTRALLPGAAAAVASAALLAALGAIAWLVLAAAERPSALAPPTLRADAPWLRGPLAGLLPSVATSPARLGVDLVVVVGVVGAAWLVAWITAPALPVKVVGAVISACYVVLLLAPPLALTDFFNYLVYGRMAAHGLNPYRALPAALHGDPAYALSNWHHLPSPYGPLMTLVAQPLAALSLPAAFWAWKAIVVASALGIVGLAGWLARRLGHSPQRAMVAAGLCPVVLVWGVGGFHNDAPSVLLVVAAAACLLRGRDADAGRRWDVAAGVLVVLAAGIKPSFALAAPLLVLGARRRGPAIAGAAVAAVAVGLVMLIDFGGALPAVGRQSALVTPLSLPNLLGLAAGHGGADAAARAAGQAVLALLAVVATVAVLVRRSLALTAVALLLFASVLCLPWVMPWYLWWALPFVAAGIARPLTPVIVLATAWLAIGGVPQLPSLLHSAGYFPTRHATGMANHLRFQRLVR